MFEIAVYPEERSTTNQLRPAVLCSKGAAPRSFGNGEKGGKRDRNEGHVHEVGESAPPGYLLFFFFRGLVYADWKGRSHLQFEQRLAFMGRMGRGAAGAPRRLAAHGLSSAGRIVLDLGFKENASGRPVPLHEGGDGNHEKAYHAPSFVFIGRLLSEERKYVS